MLRCLRSPLCSGFDATDKLGAALGHDVALLIERDHVIAVVEHDGVDQAAKVRLQILGVLEARHIVIARMHDQRRLTHLVEVGLHERNQLIEVGERAHRRAEHAGLARVAAQHAGHHERAHAFVLQAVRLVLGQVELELHRHRAKERQSARVPGHRPAVELQGRREQQQALHALGPLLRQPQRQDAAHRQPARDDDVAVLAQPVVAFLDAGVPLLPSRAAQLFRRAAMPGQLDAVDGMAGAGERLRHETQLGRRAAQAMDQQHANAATGDEQAAILKQVFVLSVHVVTYTDWAYDPLSRRGHTRPARMTPTQQSSHPVKTLDRPELDDLE